MPYQAFPRWTIVGTALSGRTQSSDGSVEEVDGLAAGQTENLVAAFLAHIIAEPSSAGVPVCANTLGMHFGLPLPPLSARSNIEGFDDATFAGGLAGPSNEDFSPGWKRKVVGNPIGIALLLENPGFAAGLQYPKTPDCGARPAKSMFSPNEQHTALPVELHLVGESDGQIPGPDHTPGRQVVKPGIAP